MSEIPEILQELYLKNLAFFEKRNPQIHQVISNMTPDHSKVVITEEGAVDLNYNGKHIYGGDAIKYAEMEVAEFNQIYQSGRRINSINAVMPDNYSAPRFFHEHLNQTVIDMYKAVESVHTNVIYNGDRHDFLIVCGIGLGLHITELVEKTNIQNLVILETDFELLTLSCFFTDWERIYEAQSPEKNKSITFILLNNKHDEVEKGSLWNELIKRAPHFPYNTVFYNHGRHHKYGDIIRGITSDIYMFISLWGFYDDEVNQLNHILHNINQGIKLIPSRDSFKWDKPVIICGSGPSLDARMHQLKSIRDKCILLTAGTALSAILKNDLVPDFHIEIESDYSVFNAIKSANDEEKLKDITLICAIQCSPFITTLFKNAISFVKDSSSIGDIIESEDNKLKEPTPTCVNAAMSLALQYRADTIFLFGTDFGFYDEENHHSKGVIYLDENSNGEEDLKLKKANLDNMKKNFKRPGYNGDCLTTSLYFTTKRRLEMLIRLNTIRHRFKIFNCSDGLIIDKTHHLDSDKVIDIEMNTESDSKRFFENIRPFSANISQDLDNKLYKNIKELCDLLIKNVEQLKPDTFHLSALSWSISNYIDATFSKKSGSVVYFIRGSIWHYLVSGYSIAYAVTPENQEKVIKIWKHGFIDLLRKLPQDLHQAIHKPRPSISEDPALRRTIKE